MTIVRGVDFCNTPDRRSPIVVADCVLNGTVLTVQRLRRLTTLADFDHLLHEPGPWITGFDFPFGMPRRLIEMLGMPRDWSAYVAAFAAMGSAGFMHCLDDYRAGREESSRNHRRETDSLAGAASPMSTLNPPAAKMFVEGAPRLLASGCHIPGLRPTDSDRVAVEAYPRAAANHLIGMESYTGPAPQARGALAMLVGELVSAETLRHYGLMVRMSDALMAEVARAEKGDEIDAVLCALTAAWAWTHRADNHGVPGNADPLEGWIVGPAVGESGG